MLPIATIRVENPGTPQVRVVMVSDVLSLRARIASLEADVAELQEGGGGGGTPITIVDGMARFTLSGTTYKFPVGTVA